MTEALPDLSDVHTIVFDFDGVFTDNKVWVDQDGRESVRCDRGDGLAFDLLRAYQTRDLIKAKCFILSKEANPVVLARAKKLKLDCIHGVSNKLEYMYDYFKRYLPNESNPFAGFIYIGNDLNDFPVMRRAGFAVAPADAHPLIQNISDLVLEQHGGQGFVRCFIEQLLKIDQLSEEEIDELISHC